LAIGSWQKKSEVGRPKSEAKSVKSREKLKEQRILKPALIGIYFYEFYLVLTILKAISSVNSGTERFIQPPL